MVIANANRPKPMMLKEKLLVYFLVGIAFGATAYLTNSTLPAILPHMIGDLTFFTLVWPNDAARPLVLDSGADNWFWIHVAQAIVFTVLAVWAFQRLAKESSQDPLSGRPILASASWLVHSSFGIFIESRTAQVRIKATLDTGC